MGRPQFETVVASAPRKKVSFQNLSSSTAIAVDQTVSVSVFAPAGKVATIKGIEVSWGITSGSLSGTKRFFVVNGGGTIGVIQISGANRDASIGYSYGALFGAGGTLSPADPVAQTLQVQNVVIDEANAVIFGFTNSTDIIQTSNRLLYLWMEEEELA
jgi:hypothetical protein